MHQKLIFRIEIPDGNLNTQELIGNSPTESVAGFLPLHDRNGTAYVVWRLIERR
jgi:hypothetical protein